MEFQRRRAFIYNNSVISSLDKQIGKSPHRNTGSTCLSLIFTGKKVKIIHLGDSRAIIVNKNGSFKKLVEEHKPEREDEMKRIQSLGGWIIPVQNIMRVQGTLSVSRSIGDFNLKPFISCVPDTRDLDLEKDNKWVVMATDGFWNVILSYSGNFK